MSDKKVNVISKVRYPITVNFPEHHFSRTWEREGAVKSIDYDILQEGMSQHGFEYMIKTGMLYIEDMNVKKELDVEPEDATEPVNIIVYSDKEIKELFSTKKSLKAFEEALEKTTDEQRKNIAHKAVDLKLNDIEKARVLYEMSGVNVAALIEEKVRDEKEAAEAAENTKTNSTRRGAKK